MSKDINALQDHTIICGFGRMGRAHAQELHDSGHPFVAIDTRGGAVSRRSVGVKISEEGSSRRRG